MGGINQITYDEARKRAAEIYQRLVGELSPTVIERKVSALEKLQISKELRSRVQGEAVEKNEKNFEIIGSKFATLEQLFYG